jgi:ribosomal-protein-alanine N-acetyltransferase
MERFHMIIRDMTEVDLTEICNIEQESFSDPWSYEDFLESFRNEHNSYLVAEQDDVIVGYCGYWGVGEEGYIYNVAVRKDYRRRQIGYRMLTELIIRAQEKGITALTLEVRKSNEAAIGLYERLGFESVGIRKDFYSKPREDAVIMWLKPIQQFPL